MKQSYAAAEIEARQRQAGIWRDADPVPLLEFRRVHQKLGYVDSGNHTVSHAGKNSPFKNNHNSSCVGAGRGSNKTD